LKRGVAYCENKQCFDYHKANLILGPGQHIYCQICGSGQHIVMESFDIIGRRPFKQVTVEFDYDPEQKRYRGAAICRDDSIEGGTYIHYSPLVKHSTRALAIAEMRLANLTLGLPVEGAPLIVDWDLPIDEYRAQLAKWQAAVNLTP
jgi:hypothetical protein